MPRPSYQHIIISRTDKIGDVILTLPLAGLLKKEYPDTKITFLGNTYTQSVIKESSYVDAFLNWDEIKENAVENLRNIKADVIIHVFPNSRLASAAKEAGIKLRIGTSHRFFHWLTCNSLINLGRKNSHLHEAQLNLKLLAPLGVKNFLPLNELPYFYGWQHEVSNPSEYIVQGKFNLILHTKSKGSAREWPLKNYLALANNLPPDEFNLILSGTAEEKRLIENECEEIFKLKHIKDTCGKLDLNAFVELIKASDGLVACSTGPLHIAAASGIFALGLYPPIKPMHPGRWAPVGEKASFIVKDISCSLCRKGGDCLCLNEISVETVLKEVHFWDWIKTKIREKKLNG